MKSIQINKDIQYSVKTSVTIKLYKTINDALYMLTYINLN